MQRATQRPLKILLKNKRFYYSALFLIISAILDSVNGASIQLNFPDRQPIPDLLFQLLPYVAWTQYLSDLANVLSAFLLAVYLFPKRWQKLPFVLTVIGLGYLLRAFIILLNPYGGPLGNIVHYGITTFHQYGEFPSGHMMLTVMVYLLIEKDNQKLKNIALFSVIVEAASLLLSHGHYSIDIIGGWLVGYFSYHVLKKDEQKMVITYK